MKTTAVEFELQADGRTARFRVERVGHAAGVSHPGKVRVFTPRDGVLVLDVDGYEGDVRRAFLAARMMLGHVFGAGVVVRAFTGSELRDVADLLYSVAG